MPIDNRDLPVGTKLLGTHKKTTYICEVVATPEGKTAFQLENGRLFNSPSSAGKAVMNGISCNGWRFWSLAGEHPKEGRTPPASGEGTRAKTTTTAKRL